LEAISGRQRKRQIKLAKKFKISFPNPAGGCLLCEKKFCRKVMPLLKMKEPDEFDVSLVKTGRHFSNWNIVTGGTKKRMSRWRGW
jgi:tRNA-uridine 2-sulfurtransferase